jgi:hypothetical protein
LTLKAKLAMIRDGSQFSDGMIRSAIKTNDSGRPILVEINRVLDTKAELVRKSR